jgi:tol-pal system protein YbgF
MMADLRILQEQSQQLQNLIAQLTETLKTVDSRLSTRIDDQINAARKSMADQKLVIDTVSRDLGVLREKVDDASIRLGSLSQEVDALRQLVTQLNTARTTFLAPDDPANLTPPETTPLQAPATTPLAPGASPARMFGLAMNDYYGGNFAFAITGFEGYIKSFPRSEQTAEAQHYIGECHIQLAQYEAAVEAFDTEIRLYPGSKSIPEAYYRKGLALEKLNRSDEARAAFEFVLKTYPESDAARLATQRVPPTKKP